MIVKKTHAPVSPDTSKLQEVVIDSRTKIYIGRDADPVEAKLRFLQRISAKLPDHTRRKKEPDIHS